MKTSANRPLLGNQASADRGSVLITALIFSIVIGIALVGYIRLSNNSLKLAHRTFFADAANNLAEAGTEEAVWAFNQMGNSTDATTVANAWSGWTLSPTVADAYITSMGSGYTSAPTVTFSGGGGTGAAGTATITTSYVTYNGVTTAITGVSGITITNPGSGYTSAPSVALSGGGGSGAVAQARRAATKTITFNNLDQNATGSVKVWVAGYDGSAVIPIAVAKATITTVEGAPIVKYVKIILNKTGLLPKGLIAKNGINWNGHPIADSFISSTVPGVPPFSAYNQATARANITVGSLYGPQIDLGAQGVVNGNVMLGPGVTLTGGSVSGNTIGNLSYNFTNPTPPTNSGATGFYSLGAIPATLPRGGGSPDTPAADGKYYYFVNNKTIGAVTVAAGKNVVIVGTATDMSGGLVITPTANGVPCGKVQIYMDGPMSPGNSDVNPTCWAGALEIYTTTSSTCTISGNGQFRGCLYAPFAQLRGNGGGNNSQDLSGSFVVGSVTSNGHMNFHYDEGLGSPASPKAWSLALWTELQSTADRATPQNSISETGSTDGARSGL
jgi:Tfp pilus assembly protein PilX